MPQLEQPIPESPFRREAKTLAMAFTARSTMPVTLFPLPSVFGRRSRDEQLRSGDDRGQPVNSGQQLLFCKRPPNIFCFRMRRPWFDLKYDFVLF